MRRSHPRITLPTERLDAELVSLSGEDFHHLAHVLRVRVGDEVALGDGAGMTAIAEVHGVYRDHLDLGVTSREFTPRETPMIDLFQAMTKGAKLDLVVRQNVELGINSVIPWIAGYSKKGDSLTGPKLDRLRKIAAEAAKQCRRAWEPEVGEALDFAGLKEIARGYPWVLVAWEKGASKTAQVLPEHAPENVALVVGPEGGLSDKEWEELREVGAHAVSLGHNVLRTETAGLVLQAAVRCRYGLL